MIGLIGLFLAALAHVAYNYTYMGDITNASIIFFSMQYIGYVLAGLDLAFKEYSDVVRYSILAFCLYFLFLIVNEIVYVNVPFDEYMENVNNRMVVRVTEMVIGLILIYISLTAWGKRLTKR